MASKHQCGKSNIVSFPNKPAHPERVADDRYSSAIRKINPLWIVERLFGKHHWASEWVISLCEFDAQFLLHFIDQSPDHSII